MLVESEEKLSGNARFEGFTVDLAAALSSQLHFNFTFKLVDDGNVSKCSVFCWWGGGRGPYVRASLHPYVRNGQL